jgi:hypothetical protein
MYSVVNIPLSSNKSVELVASVMDDSAWVRVVDSKLSPPFNSSGVCDLHIGDHMFAPDKRDDLRLMVAKAIAFAIEKGRDAGYAHAQAEIRAALGIVR